jgi:hypothetical protein
MAPSSTAAPPPLYIYTAPSVYTSICAVLWLIHKKERGAANATAAVKQSIK